MSRLSPIPDCVRSPCIQVLRIAGGPDRRLEMTGLFVDLDSIIHGRQCTVIALASPSSFNIRYKSPKFAMFDMSRICRDGEGQGTFLVRTCDARGIPRSRIYPSIVLRSAPLYHVLTISSNDYFDVRVKVDSAALCTTTCNTTSDYDVACTRGSLNST
jgi:hypothetical protein